MNAVIKTGGKQYWVREGDIIKVERLNSNVGDVLDLKDVLYVDGVAGRPYVNGAVVRAEVIEHGKHKKVIIFKHKRRKNYRRKKGMRQPYTALRIKEIISEG